MLQRGGVFGGIFFGGWGFQNAAVLPSLLISQVQKYEGTRSMELSSIYFFLNKKEEKEILFSECARSTLISFRLGRRPLKWESQIVREK